MGFVSRSWDINVCNLRIWVLVFAFGIWILVFGVWCSEFGILNF